MMLHKEKYWINPDVTTTKFVCDLEQCKGACCTFPGGSGAPIDQDEIPELKNAFPIARKYLPEEHVRIVERDGLFHYHDSETMLRCYNDRACVFVMYEDSIAKCSIQHAYQKGELSWIKPRSCYLFPIRVSRNGMMRLEFEKFTECTSALRRGENDNISLVTFLEQPLRQECGDELYDSLQKK